MNFREAWQTAVDRNNSVLCAGIDPPEFGMGRGTKGLPEGINKADWAEKYLLDIVEFASAIKPNAQFWQSEGDPEALGRINLIADHYGIPVIQDRKLADIGDTNDAGIYAAQRVGAQAVTLAPYAGNMQQAQQAAEKRGVSLITMCLMSNPEYAQVKNTLVPIGPGEEYFVDDVRNVNGVMHALKYVRDASEARRHGLAGIVIGAPSKDNHITIKEIDTARFYAGENMLVLMPGVGKQGGDERAVWNFFGPNDVIVNVGSDLMFAANRAERAKYYQDRFNEGRSR